MFTTYSLIHVEKSDSNNYRGTETPLTKIDLTLKFLSSNILTVQEHYFLVKKQTLP